MIVWGYEFYVRVLISYQHFKNVILTAQRWLSWLSTGLSCGRPLARTNTDIGSLNNCREYAAFVMTSENG